MALRARDGQTHALIRSAVSNDTDNLLPKCWGRQECWSCLDQGPCSWCPTTSTCVPNPYSPHVLGAFINPDICPLWSERWEVRTRPLGCHVSTITLLTCIISVVATMVVIAFAVLAVRTARWIIPQWKARSPGWWKLWRYYKPGWWKAWMLELRDKEPGKPSEIEPLLG